jgi:trigger factor
MNAKSSLEEISLIEKKICIEISPQEVNQEIDDAFSYVRKNFSVKGFRRGHIPQSILEQQYANAVSEDVAAKLIEKSFTQVVEEKKLVVVSKPQFDHDKPKKGESFKYTAQFEIKPKVSLKKYTGLRIEIPKLEVTREMEERRWNALREEHSVLKPVAGREKVASGDFVELEFSYGETALERKSPSVEIFEAKEGALPPEMLAAVTGAAIKEEKTTSIGHAGESKSVWFKVLGIKEKKLPNFDDDFAKSLGRYSNLQELKDQVRTDIGKQMDDIKGRVIKSKLMDTLVAENDFVIPQSMVKREYDWLVAREKDSLTSYSAGAKEVAYFREREPNMKKIAEKNVRQTLLLEAIAKAENLVVDEDDLEAFFDEQAKLTHEPLAKIKGELGNGRARLAIEEQLLEQKAFSRIKETCFIAESSEK